MQTPLQRFDQLQADNAIAAAKKVLDEKEAERLRLIDKAAADAAVDAARKAILARLDAEEAAHALGVVNQKNVLWNHLSCRDLCENQLRRVRAESSRRPPPHRRDACSMAWRCRFLTARQSQHGRVIAAK